MIEARELAKTIIEAWDQDQLKGKFWHDVVYKQCYPILHKPDPNPVGYTGSGSIDAISVGAEGFLFSESGPAHPIPLYASPQHPKPLNYDEIEKIFIESRDYMLKEQGKWAIKDFAKAIEKAHGIT
ncbi:MAG: hypothetical protein ACXWAT_00650 [Methylobacter sp.]